MKLNLPKRTLTRSSSEKTWKELAAAYGVFDRALKEFKASKTSDHVDSASSSSSSSLSKISTNDIKKKDELVAGLMTCKTSDRVDSVSSSSSSSKTSTNMGTIDNKSIHHFVQPFIDDAEEQQRGRFLLKITGKGGYPVYTSAMITNGKYHPGVPLEYNDREFIIRTDDLNFDGEDNRFVVDGELSPIIPLLSDARMIDSFFLKDLKIHQGCPITALRDVEVCIGGEVREKIGRYLVDGSFRSAGHTYLCGREQKTVSFHFNSLRIDGTFHNIPECAWTELAKNGHDLPHFSTRKEIQSLYDHLGMAFSEETEEQFILRFERIVLSDKVFGETLRQYANFSIDEKQERDTQLSMHDVKYKIKDYALELIDNLAPGLPDNEKTKILAEGYKMCRYLFMTYDVENRLRFFHPLDIILRTVVDIRLGQSVRRYSWFCCPGLQPANNFSVRLDPCEPAFQITPTMYNQERYGNEVAADHHAIEECYGIMDRWLNNQFSVLEKCYNDTVRKQSDTSHTTFREDYIYKLGKCLSCPRPWQSLSVGIITMEDIWNHRAQCLLQYPIWDIVCPLVSKRFLRWKQAVTRESLRAVHKELVAEHARGAYDRASNPSSSMCTSAASKPSALKDASKQGTKNKHTLKPALKSCENKEGAEFGQDEEDSFTADGTAKDGAAEDGPVETEESNSGNDAVETEDFSNRSKRRKLAQEQQDTDEMNVDKEDGNTKGVAEDGAAEPDVDNEAGAE